MHIHKNLKTFAKKFTEKNPRYSALLLDARGHGKSSKKIEQSQKFQFDPPHTMKECAMDVIETINHLNLTKSENESPIGIIGHSFGARIALQYLHTLSNPKEQQQSSISPPQQTWLLDAVPGHAHSSVENVIRAVSSIEIPISNKKQLVHDLTEKKLIDPAIAAWMTTNLIPMKDSNGFDFSFDLDIVLCILDQFQNQDFNQILKDIQMSRSASQSCQIHMVRALKNKSWTTDILQSFRPFMNSSQNFLKIHELNTGHWVHVDDLNGLLNVLNPSFKR